MHELLAAAPPWYTNGTLWAVIGAVLAVLAIIVSIVLWRVGTPPSVLEYGVPTATALLNQRTTPPNAGLEVMVRGKAVSNPWVATLQITNRGRRDIKTADFDQAKPLIITFDSAEVVGMLNGNKLAGLPIRVDDHHIILEPTLIHGGQQIRMDLLTDGSPEPSCDSDHLIDVRVRRGEQYRRSDVRDMRTSVSLSSLIRPLVITLLIYAFGLLPFLVSANAGSVFLVIGSISY